MTLKLEYRHARIGVSEAGAARKAVKDFVGIPIEAVMIWRAEWLWRSRGGNVRVRPLQACRPGATTKGTSHGECQPLETITPASHRGSHRAALRPSAGRRSPRYDEAHTAAQVAGGRDRLSYGGRVDIEAVAAQIIPTDDSPGAREAGSCTSSTGPSRPFSRSSPTDYRAQLAAFQRRIANGIPPPSRSRR